ncbi:MAG: DNA polymerase III subunit gamma/tau [Bacilli bacterium]|nr:DNA polymerase III subunit gamma/tau [Bacilli bacterium]
MMMYQALYRKYRPQTFDDVVGQDVVVKTLKNTIKNHKNGHAYLFFGPRGTGKTTISKIFARAVNCTDSKDGNPCGKCNNCKKSIEKECVDIIEMDAASNNGVEEIRELRNKISLVPAELTYKVYIIDEVHMLSTGAFNALLKTLEEPPEHAIFILATTNRQKIPETIISRCQCFNFKRISNDEIVNNLKKICKSEKIKVEDDVLEEIALSSDGGMRDSIGSLDKLSSYNSDKITYDDYIEINELLRKSELKEFCDSIYGSDIKKVLEIINDINNSGKNLIQVLSQIMYYLRDNIVNYYLDKKNSELDDKKRVCFEKLVNIINENMFDIKNSSNPKIYIEVVLLKFIEENGGEIISREIKTEEKENISQEIKEKIPKKEEKVEKTVEKDKKPVKNKKIVKGTKILNIKDIMDVRVNNTLATANKKVLNEEKEKLNKLNDYTFDQKIGYLVCEILNSKFRVVNDDSIVMSYEYDSIVDQNLENLDNMEKIYNKITNSNKNFAIISDKEWNDYKNNYIEMLKNGKKIEVKEEPEKVFDKEESNDIISSDTIDLFGDIVEVE